LEIFSSQMTPLNGDKDCHDFQYAYSGIKLSIKLQLFDHRSQRCLDAPTNPKTNKPICIPMFSSLDTTQPSNVLKRQIENNDASSIQLNLWT